MLTVAQLAPLKDRDPYLYETLVKIVSSVNATSQRAGVDPSTPAPAPSPVASITVQAANGWFDISVADPSGLGGATDCLDGLVRHVIGENNLDLHLGQEIHDVFRASIELGVSLLTPEAVRLGQRNALQPNVLQRLLHLVEFERLYDRLDLFHLLTSPRPASRSLRLNRASG